MILQRFLFVTIVVGTCATGIGCTDVTTEKEPGTDSETDAGSDEKADTDTSSETASLICCWCECILQTGGAPQIDESYVSDTTQECVSACTDKCQEEPRWERGNYSVVDCTDISEE